MSQEIGETRDAIIEADNKQLQDIITANRALKEPYWIVVFAKPSKTAVAGKPTLVKHIKPYKEKPPSRVGMITGEVNNTEGTITWEINMPDIPLDEGKLQTIGAKQTDGVIVETTTIPWAYVTK